MRSFPRHIVHLMTRPRVVVMGGNGFVGSAICRALVRYADVTSISRSGSPHHSSSQRTPEPWTQTVNWHAADVFDANSWQNVAKGAAAMISCVGGFGSQAQMERVCGEANVVACRTSAALSIPRFVFISAHKFNLGPLEGLLAGYYRGKDKAEAEVQKSYSSAGTIIRPSFVHGTRTLPNGMIIPLSLIGSPLAVIAGANVFRQPTPPSPLPSHDPRRIPVPFTR
jgi:uncharacterized protein YbjT (DUF2867 family)